MKICPVGAELFHASGGRVGGRTDMTKLIVAFRNNAPKNGNSARFVCTPVQDFFIIIISQLPLTCTTWHSDH